MDKKLYLLLLLTTAPLALYCAFPHDLYSPPSIMTEEARDFILSRKTKFFLAYKEEIKRDNVIKVLYGFKEEILYKVTGLYEDVRSLKMARLLYEQGVPIDKRNSDPFLSFFFTGNNSEQTLFDIFTFFLSKDQSLLEQQGSFKRTPLMEACSEGYPTAVRYLLKLGAQIGVKDENGNSLLHLTAHKLADITDTRKAERLECVRLLLAHNKQPK